MLINQVLVDSILRTNYLIIILTLALVLALVPKAPHHPPINFWPIVNRSKKALQILKDTTKEKE
jgi:hypothetical protein